MADRESQFIHFHMPEEPEMLAALGAVTVRHSQLDHILRMTVKTLTGLPLSVALDATEGDGSAYLRDQIIKLAKKQIGSGTAPYLKLKALMTRCRRVTGKRNGYVHGVYAKYLDGDAKISSYEGWKDPPTIAELEALTQEIFQITLELNEARLQGFLADALKTRP